VHLICDSTFISKPDLILLVEQIYQRTDHELYIQSGNTRVGVQRTRRFGDSKNIWGTVLYTDRWKREVGQMLELALQYSRNEWLFYPDGELTESDQDVIPPARVEISNEKEVLASYPPNSVQTENYPMIEAMDFGFPEDGYQIKYYMPYDLHKLVVKGVFRVGLVLLVCALYLFVEPWIFRGKKKSRSSE